MTNKSIIIIGAGLAGLSAGCYARMNGYQTHIFEHHKMPGGLCTAWKRGPYTFDGCIHWLAGCLPDSVLYKVYQEIGAFQKNRVLQKHFYGRFLDEATGRSIDITSDLDRLERDFHAASPGDKKIINEIMKGIRAFMTFDMDMGKPQEIKTFLDSITELWKMRRWIKYFIRYGNITAADFALRIKDPFLRWVITNFFAPDMPAFIMLMFFGQLAAGQFGVIEGGSQQFSDAICERYTGLGGKITFGATVEEICVENDQAVGVRLADGSVHKADIIVSAADGHSTIFSMLGGKYCNQTLRERYEKWPLFPGLLLITFGVSQLYPEAPCTSTIKLQHPVKLGNRESDSFHIRIFNYDPTLAPEGKSVIQVAVKADYQWWTELQKDRPAYEAEKQRIIQLTAQSLEPHFPGISSHLEISDVATPHTFIRYTRNYKASFEGWMMNPETLRTKFDKTLPGLKNFYMAGQWVEPGGGIPPVIVSGRNVVRIICHRDQKPFKAEIPAAS